MLLTVYYILKGLFVCGVMREKIKGRDMIKKFLIFVLLFCGTLFSKEIPQSNIISPGYPVRLFHGNKGFTLKVNDTVYAIKNEQVDKELRGLKSKELDVVLGNRALVTFNDAEIEFSRVPYKAAQHYVSNAESLVASASYEMSTEILSQLPRQNHIKVLEYSDGSFGLRFSPTLNGGGFWGAIGGAWLGKAVASVVCHGAIVAVGAAVSVVGTPAAGWVVVTALEGTLGTTIEATTTAAALAGGIAGAVATGPV